MQNKTTKAVLCATLGNIIWGFSFLFTKVGLEFVHNPNVMLAHRFFLSSLFMLVPLLIGRSRISFRGKKWGLVLLLLLMQLCYYLFESYALLYTNTTISGLVLAAVPVVAIGTGIVFLKEYPTKRQVLFCVLPVTGVIMITVSGGEMGVIPLRGGIFLLLTLLSSAIYKTVNRRVAEEFSPYERTFMVLTISALTFAVAGLKSVSWDVSTFFAPLMHPKYFGAVVSLSLFCSIGANLLVNYAAGNMSVFKVSSFGSLSTLCAALVGVVFLKEPVSAALILGAILILVGIRLVTKSQQEGKRNV